MVAPADRRTVVERRITFVLIFFDFTVIEWMAIAKLIAFVPVERIIGMEWTK